MNDNDLGTQGKKKERMANDNLDKEKRIEVRIERAGNLGQRYKGQQQIRRRSSAL